MAQMVKRLPTLRETRVRSPGWEDPLAKEMATHSSILAWKIPWTEEPGGLQSMGCKESDMTEQFHFTCGGAIAHMLWFKLLCSQGFESWIAPFL